MGPQFCDRMGESGSVIVSCKGNVGPGVWLYVVMNTSMLFCIWRDWSSRVESAGLLDGTTGGVWL